MENSGLDRPQDPTSFPPIPLTSLNTLLPITERKIITLFSLTRQDNVLEEVVRGWLQNVSEYGWELPLSRPDRSRGNELGFKVIGGLQHKWRTLNTWLCSSTSAGSFACSIQQWLSRSRHEKRTEYEFCTRSKRMLGKSVLTFRTQNLVDIVLRGSASENYDIIYLSLNIKYYCHNWASTTCFFLKNKLILYVV